MLYGPFHLSRINKDHVYIVRIVKDRYSFDLHCIQHTICIYVIQTFSLSRLVSEPFSPEKRGSSVYTF